MKTESLLEFVDTNILVCAFDASAGNKQSAAQGLLKRLWDSRTGVLSIQVLQEFFVAATRSPKSLPIEEAARAVSAFSMWRIFIPTADDVLAAIAISTQAQLNFWDAMLLQAAAESECGVFWSEDLNDGQIVRGVQIRNPFTG